ncbi:hypothetical protein GTS_56660 [Gandjariella thermophila]|uniref:Uncharacterized protein n=1 Tax=Gandjariella thermophila TaxID=1931992 RepID=A0A4D4JJE7_9PSEU|nr:hypothetical protein GTS_56660 [Gandjariella thermophila]
MRSARGVRQTSAAMSTDCQAMRQSWIVTMAALTVLNEHQVPPPSAITPAEEDQATHDLNIGAAASGSRVRHG